MIKSIVIVVVLFSGTAFLSQLYIGYPAAGKKYITKKRKSIRHGSGMMMIYGSRGFRGGK